MYTQCPSCHTVFRLIEAQVTAAAGSVRCGVCGSIFDCRERLLQELPVYLQLAVPPAGAGGRKGPPSRAPIVSPASLGAVYHQGGAAALAPPHRRWTTWAWGGGIVFAMMILVAQYGYFMRADLARYPQLRPAVAALCGALRCRLPAQRDLSQIAVLDRQVYEDPAAPGALLVTAEIENRAPYSQPFPVLQLSLSAIDGKLLAQGRFTPRQYLAGTSGDHMMLPHRPAKVRLEIADPGSAATGFELSFL